MSRPSFIKRNNIVEVQEAQERSTNVSTASSVESFEQRMIHKVILPITISMRILGLYFEKTDKVRVTQQNSCFYCLLIVVIMWLNVIRMFTIFTADDTLLTILGNIGTLVWIATGTVVQTSCFRASQNGRILEVLQILNKDMSSVWAKHLRVKVIICVAIAWIYTAFGVLSTAYVLLGENGFLNPLITPINTMIHNSSRLTLKVVGALYLVLHFYISGSIIFPAMWNYVYCL